MKSWILMVIQYKHKNSDSLSASFVSSERVFILTHCLRLASEIYFHWQWLTDTLISFTESPSFISFIDLSINKNSNIKIIL